ncbi:hypothetical protein DQ04_14801000 [Trypanosoma grayi]|uniref:hypothetical protein n=1 Tax=Trypanosoma grayi TaxID=71804 RepID=UPI0004F3F3F1|nr:hypothetical protein DQ04_14801000 [Trypanosoma grayi]KEG06291.1 hypothetical protein DQ04_14801000 [Trypanosoma grayi]
MALYYRSRPTSPALCIVKGFSLVTFCLTPGGVGWTCEGETGNSPTLLQKVWLAVFCPTYAAYPTKGRRKWKSSRSHDCTLGRGSCGNRIFFSDGGALWASPSVYSTGVCVNAFQPLIPRREHMALGTFPRCTGKPPAASSMNKKSTQGLFLGSGLPVSNKCPTLGREKAGLASPCESILLPAWKTNDVCPYVHSDI